MTAVSASGQYAYLSVTLNPELPRAEQELLIYDTLSSGKISINLVKLHPGAISFVAEVQDGGDSTRHALEAAGFRVQAVPSVTMVSVYAAGMRGLSGVMARIYGALIRCEVPVLQTGDGPDTVFCLVESACSAQAVGALSQEFGVAPPAPRIVVQKFGGKSVGTPQARRLAAERVKEAFEAGLKPVIVVSAIGRRGEPYATDTLLEQLAQVDPHTEPAPRERDMLMACGEIISTVIMAQTLKALGLRAVALTGAQAGILTDYKYGDAQILDINPSYIHQLLNEGETDVVVVAGFQGVTEQGAITTLGRGGSDTTASALGAALGAESVEIYTHVDGVMTADPEVVPDARTLAMVTYEEVCNMAHQGAKVIHPRAAEIAMMHRIPLWVKSSFVRARGTLVAPLAELELPQKRAVTGVATISRLVQFTVTGLHPGSRQQAELAFYQALGDACINLYLTSVGADTSAFIVDEEHAGKVRAILDGLGHRFETTPDCEMVSVVALNMWEEPGFLGQIAHALYSQGVDMLQMADSEGTVACLVRKQDGPRATQALHGYFGLGGSAA